MSVPDEGANEVGDGGGGGGGGAEEEERRNELRALEFYSGIGGLHYSLLRARARATVVASFDINPNGEGGGDAS